MIFIILGLGLGILLCYSFIQDFLTMKKGTEKALINGTYSKNNHYYGLIIFNLIGILIGLLAIYLSIQPETKDNVTLALGIGLSLMFAGQCLPLFYTASYYYNENSIITCGKLIRFKSVKTIETKSAVFMKNFMVTTFNGDEILVSKKTALYLEEKTGKKISSRRKG